MRKDRFYISIDEFDAPCEIHEFSEGYKKTRERNKQKYLYKKPRTMKIASIAVAAAALFVATPFVVNAATNGEFFERIWGMLGKSNIEAHQELVYEAEKNTYYYVDYPAREYDELDPDVAEALIGDCVEYLDISKEVDGTTITILSAVRDDNSAVVELSFEKEGGVDVLNYSQLDNESKGAWFSDESTFWLNIGYGGNMYVDLDRSTDEKVYCYYYVSLNAFGAGNLRMEINQYPCTLGERNALSMEENGDELIGAIENEKTTIYVNIPCENRLESTEFVNNDGGIIELSPISMNIDMMTGLGFTAAEAYDPGNVKKICITYNDGSTYTVIERDELYIENIGYSCGSINNEYLLLFNRLVDTDNVLSITVNGVEYTR